MKPAAPPREAKLLGGLARTCVYVAAGGQITQGLLAQDVCPKPEKKTLIGARRREGHVDWSPSELQASEQTTYGLWLLWSLQ